MTALLASLLAMANPCAMGFCHNYYPRAQASRVVGVRMCSCVRTCHQKKIVIEQTRDLIYLKFVATDFFPKTISPSAGENSGDLA